MNVIFFNRVPKVGSQTLMELMKRLGKINRYPASRDIAKKHETIMVGPLQEMELAYKIVLFDRPAVYSQHIAFINFTKLSLPRPIYINLIRDPIERVVSWHYYIRTKRYYESLRKTVSKDIKTPNKKFMEMDFDTCVLTGDKHCQFNQNQKNDKIGDHKRQTLFFCGQSKSECMPFNSKTALQRAKRTVEEDYAVVGTWEERNITLSVLENYVPLFFKHAKFVYYLDQEHLSKINSNKVRRNVSTEVREILQRNFTNEIEFYQFCKQRLYKQYDAIKLNIDYDTDYMDFVNDANEFMKRADNEEIKKISMKKDNNTKKQNDEADNDDDDVDDDDDNSKENQNYGYALSEDNDDFEE